MTIVTLRSQRSNLNLHKKNEHQKPFPCRDLEQSEFCDKCATELRTGAQLKKHMYPNMNKNTVISAENGLHQHHNINNHRHEEHSNTNPRFNVKSQEKYIYFKNS